MDLKDRLRRAFGEARESVESDGESERPKPSGKPGVLPGRVAMHHLGAYWLRTEDHPLSTPQGFRRLEEVLHVAAGRLKLLAGDPGLEQFDPRKAIFLDTETTSLAGGAGVFVFMAGIGFIHQGRFRVEQYFMRDYDEENAMLTAFNERIAGFEGMVSFFGKNFDRYRLEDRMGMLGIESALPVHCHLDLYHVGRRLYRGRFPDLRLKTIEHALLGVKRVGDIPGAECPEAYFQYLRGKDDGRMADVFYHNLQDILSLAVLSAEVDGLAALPSSPHDRYALACVYLKGGMPDEAYPLLEDACENLPPGPLALDALLKRVGLLKRMKRHRHLEDTLNRLVDLDAGHPKVLTEMAKYQEHTCKDFEKALHFAVRARCALKGGDPRPSSRARLIRDAEHRIVRLKKKRDRA